MARPEYAIPTGEGASGTYWSALVQGELRLPRCSVCGAWRWYPDSTGPHCPGAELEWTLLPGSGTVFTHTTVRRPFLPDNDRSHVPFAVILVEPDGAEGVRVLGNLADGTEPEIGMRVVLDVVDSDGPRPVFRPEKGAMP